MFDEDFDNDFSDSEEKTPHTDSIKDFDERQRYLKEQIELRQMAKELELSVEDYLEAFGDK